jgi:hypothetical protein
MDYLHTIEKIKPRQVYAQFKNEHNAQYLFYRFSYWIWCYYFYAESSQNYTCFINYQKSGPATALKTANIKDNNS